MTKSLIIFMVALIVITIPFSMNDSKDGIEALLLSDSTVGNYQSTTCKISLTEFYFLLVSSKRSAAKDVLLGLQKQGYLHPQLTDAVNRAQDDI